MEHIDFNLDWKFYKTHADWEEGNCPTGERHGWSGDAQIFVNTASYKEQDLFNNAEYLLSLALKKTNNYEQAEDLVSNN